MLTNGVAALLAPRNVVLVGASDRAGHWSQRVQGNLTRFGFAGAVYPVNPGRTEIWGEACYADLDGLPEPPDHLAMFVPASVTLDVLEKGAALGARSVTLFASGFGEGGDTEGRARAERLRALAAETGLAVAGPNCIGVASAKSHFVTMADEQLAVLKPGPIAIVTQSGGLATSLNRALTDRGLEIAHLISAGNQVCLTFADYIDHFADDPDVRVILGYIESVRDRDRFLAAAAKARANGKTVVVIKIGGSEAARSAALSHTGNLAGRLDVFDAYARDVGIVRVETVEELVEAAAYLSRAPRPKGTNVAFITNSGAVRSLITEEAAAHGVTLAVLSEETRTAMRAVLNDVEPTNPLDTRNTIAAEKLMGCVSAFDRASEVDLIVAVEELPREPIERKITNLTSLNAYCTEDKADRTPLMLLSPVPFQDTPFMTKLSAALPALPQLRGLGTTMRLLGALARPMSVSTAHPDGPTPEGLVRELRARVATLMAPTTLDEVTSKRIINEFGLHSPKEQLVTTPDEAVAAAAAIGYPVVLKAVSPDVAHKSDAGLVMLGLSSSADVRHAASMVIERTAQIGAHLDGLLIAEQVSGGVEALLGLHRDPELGLAVMVGLGGVMLELIDDVAIVTPSAGPAETRVAIAETKLARRLAGYRGSPPCDLDALVDAVVAMGRLANALGDVIESIDVNPLLVREKGKGVVALDALVVLRPVADRH